MLDVAQLLEPVSEEAPCGVDLEYDPDFLALDEAARGKPDRQMGDSIIAGEPPDWREVEEQSIQLLGKTKDLRIACHLTRASLALHGLPGLTAGLSLIRQLCEKYWQPVYPLLDAEDDNDPTMRMNGMASLAAETGLLRDLRECRLAVATGIGAVKFRDAEIALEVFKPTDEGGGPPPMTAAEVDGIVQTQLEAGGELRNDPQLAFDQAHALSDVLSEHVAVHLAVDLAPLMARLKPVAALYRRIIESLAPVADGAAGAGGPAGALSLAGEIQNRDQAVRLLDKVCQYFERAEPANPAPLLIRRAQRLMTMSFLDIMRDMAPDSVPTIENIAGVKPDESQSN